ncbi:MAG: SRPBCC domain-containing protein [Aggregatilineales bacterium]
MEDNTLKMQIKLDHPKEQVFKALTTTDALKAWFAEDADIAIDDKRYAFWGKFTPGNPDKSTGTKHEILEIKPDELLKFRWQTTPEITTVVEFHLREDDGITTLLVLQTRSGTDMHHAAVYTMEDFWFLTLENLRRYLDGKPSDARVDFSAKLKGNITWDTLIDAPAERVFDVLIKPEHLNKWIAHNAEVDPRIGGEFSYGWGGVPPFKIVELEPNRKLAYDWDEEDPNGDMQHTIVTWTLEESNGKTRLTIVQSGFAPDADNDGIHVGWRNFLNWIRSLSEYGDTWQPPVLHIKDPAWATFYAASISERQAQFD